MDDLKLAKFIAAANPVNVQTLIAALEQSQAEREEFRKRLKLERSILEDADKRIAELEKSLRGTEESLVAAVDQIAELETSKQPVKLHKRSVGEVMHMSGFSRDYAEGWCAGNDNAIHEIHAAGGSVEGSE
ncbi:ead/Ea22-like family protein [Buttiauxella sp. B2]|nr:ead/Ea22-like family protein [Buttiauxella sp. B2]